MRHSNGWFDDSGYALPRASSRQWKSEADRSLCASTHLDDPVAAMRRVAATLVAECNLDRPAENLKLMASFQEIVAIEAVPMADAGRLVPGERGLIVQVNRSHKRGRRHFSACHEISHTLIPSYYDGPGERRDESVGWYDEEKEEEYLCDVGAAELLLPSQSFLEALRVARAQGNTYIAIMASLAHDFQASLEATGIRLVHLGLPHTALLVWTCPPITLAKPRLRTPELSNAQDVCQGYAPLTLRYAHRSGSMERHFFPNMPLSPDATLIYGAQMSGEVTEGFQYLLTQEGVRKFWTQSQCFPMAHSSGLEHRVITIVSERKF